MLDRVVSAERIAFDDIVYNLSVEDDESYALGDIVTHNCLCVKTAIHPPPEQFASQLNAYVNGTLSLPALDSYGASIGGGLSGRLLGSGIGQSLIRWGFDRYTDLEKAVVP